MTASISGDATALRASVANETNEQYSLGRILGIWALAAVPMGLLSWLVLRPVSPDYRTDPFGASVARLVLLTLGLIWQFILCMIIVRAETGNLRWATLKRRLRLNAPRDPGTGEPRRSLWLWVIPLIIAIAVWEIALAPYATRLWVSIFPFFAEPPGNSANSVFQSPEVLARLVGAWWFLGLFLINGLFNTVVGEELLFRGILLPGMEGVFGRWSWVANGVLFGLYHVHQPWSMLANAISGTFLLAFPAWRFRSTWVSIIVHSVQTVFFAYLILGAVLGLA
jgi:membrane protease YdiL (CAAX protease family)